MAYQETTVPSSLLSSFTKVDTYINAHLLPSDPALESALKANASSDLPAIDVAPNQGKLLYLLAKLNNSKKILEVGTLGGYSAIWFAKAVGPSGKVLTLEIDPVHAEVARGNIAGAGFQDVVEIKVGAAVDTLKTLSEQAEGYALESFSRIGTVIVVDNIARRGRLADLESDESSVVGTRKLFEWLKEEEERGTSRVESTAIQTVGSKGWDGFLIATVIA